MGGRLATRLLRVIFGCYFLVTLVVTSVQLYAEYLHAEDRLQREIGAMQQTFGPGINDALWRFNAEVLRGILTGMRALPAVLGVRVMDEHGKQVVATGAIEDESGNKWQADVAGGPLAALPRTGVLDRMFQRSFDIVHVDESGERRRIGSWTIYSSRSVVLEQVKYGFVLILVNSVIKTLALWFIFLFVIERALGRPLKELSGFVGSLNVDNLGDKIFVLNDKGRHELHQLAAKINAVIAKLRQSFQDNAELVRNLEDMNRTLEAQVAARTVDLARLADTDALTGLYNRRKLDQVVAYEIERVHRYGGRLALVLCDVDHFKSVNDSFGHQAGDRVLVAMALLLRDGRRGADTVGRWGGEEFMLICPATGIEGAVELAEALRAQVEGTDFPVVGRRSCSFGVAELQPGMSALELAAKADAALYRAKQGGRNRVEAD